VKVTIRSFAIGIIGVASVSCGDPGQPQNEAEVFTTVSLTLVPTAGGPTIVAAFADPDGDGGNPPTIQPINLSNGKTYAGAVKFLNELAVPAADITLEVADEGDQHQVFFTGTAVNGPASDRPGAALTHSYSDADVNGLPIGLKSQFVAITGTGQLTLTLRHMPPLNGNAVKIAGLATIVKTSGLTAIGGETDVQVTFPVDVR
jgi:hypothetical protein